jgi:hypothetical protein
VCLVKDNLYLYDLGSVIKTALAKVYIDSPYFVGEVIAWCMQNPLYDVIIGNVEGVIYPNDPELNHEVLMLVLYFA